MIYLSLCFRQLSVSIDISAAQHEFRAGLGATLIYKNPRLYNLFPVAVFHMGQKISERLFAQSRTTLTGFMPDIVVKQGKHALIIGIIEGCVVLFDDIHPESHMRAGRKLQSKEAAL